MIALDTNILARYLLDDEPAQARAARRLLADAKAGYWIPVTVVLELAWVLRKSDAPRALVMGRLRDLLSLRNVRAQNADVPIDRRGGAGARDRDHSLPILHSRRAVVDPVAAAMLDRLLDALHADLPVVVATDRKHRCDFTSHANQVTQPAQLGRTIDQVTAQQHQIWIATCHRIRHLPAQRF